MIPSKVRVSIGTAAVLGLRELRLDASPTTAYMMLYTEVGCVANCLFCTQARESNSERSHLSRVMWPDFPTETVLRGFMEPRIDVLERICIQVINYPGFVDDTIALLKALKEATGLPVSLDTCPIKREEMVTLKGAGIERVSIPLDAATPKLFDEIKGRATRSPYRWENHMEALGQAVEVFGVGNVMSNLIVGLGETEEEAAAVIQRLMDMEIKAVLFAFTPIPNTPLADRPQPPLESYRRIQLARHLITEGKGRFEEMGFLDGMLVSLGGGVDIDELVADGTPLKTTGCPGCNRPYYNERPSGPLFNYPRDLTEEELRREKEMLMRLMKR